MAAAGTAPGVAPWELADADDDEAMRAGGPSIPGGPSAVPGIQSAPELASLAVVGPISNEWRSSSSSSAAAPAPPPEVFEEEDEGMAAREVGAMGSGGWSPGGGGGGDLEEDGWGGMVSWLMGCIPIIRGRPGGYAPGGDTNIGCSTGAPPSPAGGIGCAGGTGGIRLMEPIEWRECPGGAPAYPGSIALPCPR